MDGIARVHDWYTCKSFMSKFQSWFQIAKLAGLMEIQKKLGAGAMHGRIAVVCSFQMYRTYHKAWLLLVDDHKKDNCLCRCWSGLVILKRRAS